VLEAEVGKVYQSLGRLLRRQCRRTREPSAHLF
jgi:hypothetical protein